MKYWAAAVMVVVVVVVGIDVCVAVPLLPTTTQQQHLQPQALHPQFQAPPPGEIVFGVDAEGCTVGPTGRVCPWGAVQFTSEAKGVAQPWEPSPVQHHQQPQHHHHHGAAFTGLVGPSGVIGPSGLVGPSGPLHFGK
ncbi:hypothetical protein Pmani_015270 [Petrolisthes manimaculis]|uniref:Secreted protein n=1 Tax=Petrolisthes manimaculis TaxID=1843537 RepID=A0AAE1PSJ6_9EUCA|nr:hypothetical protein Pmani_015270 [Petrolisthes manimaculis]